MVLLSLKKLVYSHGDLGMDLLLTLSRIQGWYNNSGYYNPYTESVYAGTSSGQSRAVAGFAGGELGGDEVHITIGQPSSTNLRLCTVNGRNPILYGGTHYRHWRSPRASRLLSTQEEPYG